MTPPANTDVVRLVYEEMAKWKQAPKEQEAQRYMTELADRLINYFHIHYAAPASRPTGLPGLPGGAPAK